MIEIEEASIKIAEMNDVHSGRRQRVRDRFFSRGLSLL